MDEILKGENPLPRTGFPVMRFFISTIFSLPVLPFLLLATLVKDWFLGGETLTTIVGCLVRRAPSGLVQRAASKTAVLVAAARYIGFREGWTNDSLARHFIPYEVAKAIELTKTFEIGFPVSLFYIGFLMARTLAGDRILLNIKPKQVVLLGAGLDTRAHRLELPDSTRFYEIDIATTQSLKRRVAEAHPDEFTGKVTYVSVDFSKESFVQRLQEDAKDFDLSDPSTVILFEGVSMYLPWEALKATLEMISSNFAEGTIIGMDLIEDTFTTKEARKRQRHFPKFRELIIAVDRLGEPFQWGIPEGETVHSVFSKLGFEIVADVTAKDVERIFLTPSGAKKSIGRTPAFSHYVILQVKRSS